MSETVSKLGIHCVGPRRYGYGAFLQTINAAGRQLSLVKVRDDFGAIDEALALWPSMLTIGAMTEWDDASLVARAHRLAGVAHIDIIQPLTAEALNVDLAYTRITQAAASKPGIKYWEYLNERDGQYDEQADLYIALMPRLAPLGIGLCMFNCASGTPMLPSEGAPGAVAYAAIARACKFAKDNGYKALLGLHEYQSSGGTIERHNELADYLTTQNALIPIAITEYGFETFPGTADMMAMIQANDPEYMRDSRILGCANWTLGGGGWAASNFETALPELGNYIATVAPIEPNPPPVDEWEVEDVMIDGVSIGPQTNFNVAMTADHSVVVVAKKKVIYRTLTVAVTPSEAESHTIVTPSGGTYPDGSIIEMAVTFQ